VTGREGLFLLPGHISLAEYEVSLGIAQELSATLTTFQNLPGSISFLLDRTAELHNADYVLIDMSPSLSSINQNLLMTSENFIVPAAPDFYSVMAMDSLANIFPKWRRWAENAQTFSAFREADYPFPEVSPKFLGLVIQNYRPRGGAPAQSFQRWIEQIDTVATKTLLPSLSTAGLLLPPAAYGDCGLDYGYRLASIPDFNSLIATSQEHHTPVFALTDAQLGSRGVILREARKSCDAFREMFARLAERVVCLTSQQ
jgi:hypothetical protein